METNGISRRLGRWLSGISCHPPVYLVGGTVRDLVRGKFPKDIDLACRGAKDLAAQIASAREVSIVAMEKKESQPCYRVVNRNDAKDFLDIAELRGVSIEDDLCQRDFTINAMALEVCGTQLEDRGAGILVDPLGGLADVRKKIIRMTTGQAFTDDPLRIIRAFRFAAELEFGIDPATLPCMRTSSDLLTLVSAERIMYELGLILATPRAGLVIEEMDGQGILDRLFPEIITMKETPQNGYHHRDVWGHSLLVLQNTEYILNHPAEFFGGQAGAVSDNLARDSRLPLLKLAALFHDAGKPTTRGLNPETGRITFYGHDRAGGEITELLVERMRLSSRAGAFIVRMVREHLRPLVLSSPGATGSVRLRWFRKLGDDIVPSVILAMADVMSSLGPESGEEYRRGFLEWGGKTVAGYFSEARKILERPLLISGHDLMELGMEAGPVIGGILRQVREAQDNGEVTTRDEALAYARELLGGRAPSSRRYGGPSSAK
ncbi:MAG: HD domain-containing protein [Nitrospiraceae bacterium]|nr:HD domain-containing protein [Nitrospiraceae bacterium]